MPRRLVRFARFSGRGRRRPAAGSSPFVWLLAIAMALPLAAGTADRDVASFHKGVLWRIESGQFKPSVVFGTIHSDDARVTRLPEPVKKAFDHATSFTMEVLLNGPGIVALADAMFFNDGTTMEAVLGKDLHRRTTAALRNHGFPIEGAIKMKPWAAMMTLSVPVPTTGLFLDHLLQLEAARQNKPTYGLESVNEQIAVFNDLPMRDQIGLLRETVNNHDKLAVQIEEIIQAYLKRDLTGLAAIGESYRVADERLYRTIKDRLIITRNRAMVERMLPRIKEGNAFIAIGALHLPGDDGVLNLLRLAGYRVKAVY